MKHSQPCDCDICFHQKKVLNEFTQRLFSEVSAEYSMFKIKKKYTGIKDKNGKRIYKGDIIMGDSIVLWDKVRGMWGIHNGKYPLGDYSRREDFELKNVSKINQRGTGK